MDGWKDGWMDGWMDGDSHRLVSFVHERHERLFYKKTLTLHCGNETNNDDDDNTDNTDTAASFFLSL